MIKFITTLFLLPLSVWASEQQNLLGTWHVEKVICSSNNADLKYHDKIYFTFSLDGKFSSLKLASGIHKDTCGGKERVLPARTSLLETDAGGNLRQTMPEAQCDNGKGLRTWVLKKLTL